YFSSTHSAPTDLYTLSLHDALPISIIVGANCENAAIVLFPAARVASDSPGAKSGSDARQPSRSSPRQVRSQSAAWDLTWRGELRSEEHTSELQSRGHLVCRLLLEKK